MSEEKRSIFNPPTVCDYCSVDISKSTKFADDRDNTFTCSKDCAGKLRLRKAFMGVNQCITKEKADTYVEKFLKKPEKPPKKQELFLVVDTVKYRTDHYLFDSEDDAEKWQAKLLEDHYADFGSEGESFEDWMENKDAAFDVDTDCHKLSVLKLVKNKKGELRAVKR